MAGRRTLILHLGFLCDHRPDAGASAPSAFLRILSAVVGGEDPLVHWVIPPGMFDRPLPPQLQGLRDETASILGDRMANHGDAVIATGFRGAFHSLLSVREIERELRWATSDPWGGGIAPALGLRPSCILPPHPDLLRPAALRAYRAAGYELLGLEHSPSDGMPYDMLSRAPQSDLCFFRVLRFAPELEGAIRAVVRRSPDRIPPSVFVLFDAADTEASAVEELFAALSRRFILRFGSITKTAAAACTSASIAATAKRGAEPVTTRVPCSPAARYHWLGVDRLRRATRNQRIRTVLTALSRTDPPPAAGGPPPSLGRPDVALSSQMPGHVSLRHGPLTLVIDEGRLSRLLEDRVPELPMLPTETSVCLGRRTVASVLESAFAFEDAQTRGLRAVMSFLDTGRIVIEYALVQGFDALMIRLHASYPPSLASAAAIAPFTLSVPVQSAADVSLVCVYPDATRIEHRFAANHEVLTAAGGMFSIHLRDRSLCMFFPQEASLVQRGVQCRMERRRSGLVFAFNPFGTYSAAECRGYAGLDEQLSFFLAPGACPNRPPTVPAAVGRELRPHLVSRRAEMP